MLYSEISNCTDGRAQKILKRIVSDEQEAPDETAKHLIARTRWPHQSSHAGGWDV